jgi:4-hydroxybenzoate polyprenyltransferase
VKNTPKSTLKSKITQYALLTRQDRPVGTLLLLGSTSWGLVVAANGEHNWKIILIFLFGAWLMRSAGCIINDYADREFDRYVARTKNRPITSGAVSEREALLLFSFFVGLSFMLVLLLRIEAILMSLGALVLAVIYPFMKRFTWFPQVFLGLAFSWSIPMAFVAYQGSVPMPGWAMFVLSFLWIVAYDTIYAIVDKNDDKKIGLKSTALFFGKHTALAVAIMQALFLLGWGQAGWFHQASLVFWGALFLTAICFIYQSVLIRSNDNTKIFQAFMNNQWVGFFIFIGVFFFPKLGQ